MVMYFDAVDLDYPVTYLYTTLHYYERLLSDKHGLKKILVYSILGMKHCVCVCVTMQYLYSVVNMHGAVIVTNIYTYLYGLATFAVHSYLTMTLKKPLLHYLAACSVYN